jgi:hypothetical protein
MRVAATRFRAMELITILKRCRRFRRFVYQASQTASRSSARRDLLGDPKATSTG